MGLTRGSVTRLSILKLKPTALGKPSCLQEPLSDLNCSFLKKYPCVIRSLKESRGLDFTANILSGSVKADIPGMAPKAACTLPYQEFYGFSQKPFEVTPDPDFFYFTFGHRAILASLIRALKNKAGAISVISVIGDAGTGKTVFIHSLVRALDEKMKIVTIHHPRVTFTDLLRFVLQELNQPPAGYGKLGLLHQFKRYLNQMAVRGECLVIIIDEAQQMEVEVLKEFDLLLSSEIRPPQLVLVGQPELEDRLNSQDLRPLKKKINITHQINPLTEAESKEYLDHRLRLVGGNLFKTFTSQAISLICRRARGIPRTLNILCDNALWLGSTLSRNEIDVETVRRVIKDLEGPHSLKTLLSSKRAMSLRKLNLSGRRFLLIVLSSVCLVGLLVLLHGPYRRGALKTWEIKPSKETALSHAAMSGQGPLSSEIPRPFPRPSLSRPSDSYKGQPIEIAVVQEGQTLSSLAQKYYGMTHTTLLDLLLDFNPGINNVHLIRTNQEIRVPKITEEVLVLLSSDHTFKIHIGTFDTPDRANFYRKESLLQGKEIDLIPRSVSPQDVWYQVVTGPFDDKEKALEMISSLKKKGLLPYFGGRPNAE